MTGRSVARLLDLESGMASLQRVLARGGSSGTVLTM
jgi:hypothetical protein